MPRKAKQRARGTGSIEWRKDGKANLRWYEPGCKHPRRKKGVAGATADAELAAIIGRVKGGLPKNPTQEIRVIDDYAQRYFATRLTTNNRADHLQYNLHLRSIVGHLAPRALTPGFIRTDILLPMRHTHSGATVRNLKAVLSSMYSDMAEDGVVENNPFKSLGSKARALCKSEYDPKNGAWLKDPDVVTTFMALLCEPVSYFFSVGVMTGMRVGEIRGLDWSHVDWDRKCITVKQQVNERQRRITLCKDHDSRVVPLLAELEPLLRTWWGKCGAPKTGLVFPGTTAGFISLAPIRAEWHRVRLELGVPYMRFYDATRHTFATQWLVSGGTEWEIKDLLGHSDLKTTGRYVHMARSYAGTATRKLFGVNHEEISRSIRARELGLLVGK